MFDRSFYFLRHGETDWNKQGLMQGWIDIPLNETGRAQARTASESISALPIDLVIASPLLRAWETAEIANAGLQRKILPESGLRERYFGKMEGNATWNDLRAEGHEDPHALFEGADGRCPEGGETYLEFERRVVEAVRLHLDAAAGKTLLFVAHGGVCRVLKRVLIGSADKTPNAIPMYFKKSGDGWAVSHLAAESASR